MTVLVRAESVSRSFRSGEQAIRVLSEASLEVHAGELVLLMGPSGSGKTTLLSILAGLLRPDSGRVELAGDALTSMSESGVAAARRRSIGFVFQAFHLFEALSARDNVAEVLALRGTPIGRARTDADALLSRVGLEARRHHLPRQLSSGQKQRVAIARAVASDPPVLFGDEPTAALDGTTAIEIMELLRAQVGAARCAIVVTHDDRLVRFADRVLRLRDGRITEETA